MAAGIAETDCDVWQGAAQYRAGRYSAAIQSLKKSLEIHPAWIGRAQNHLFLAMACQALGQNEEAHDWLAKAEVSKQEHEGLRKNRRFGIASSDYMSDWLNVLVLLPEAMALVEKSEKADDSMH